MDWEALYRIVDEARRLPQTERDTFVHAECGSDRQLREEVLRILATQVEEHFMEPPEQSTIGRNLEGFQLGEFLITEELARGGMGIVYRGVQKGLNRPVAIKVLPQIQHLRSAVFQRFQREAEAASKVQHPHAVPVLSAGDTQGIAWYAMPLIEGHDLATEIRLQSEGLGQGIWPEFGNGDYVANVVRQVAGVAEALQHIHDLGILHRDIKPRNLLLSLDGQLSVVDFGLAKSTDDGTITATGDIQGTPYYMSPEQARALRHPVDHRTDVYSLSVVLFELLSLRRPIDGDTPEIVLTKIASGTQLSLKKANPRAPRDLVTICEKGMSHNPAHRYETAGELAADLRRFLSLEAIVARPTPWLRRLRRAARAHRKAFTAAAVLVGMAIAWFAASKWQATKSIEQGWLNAFSLVNDNNTPDLVAFQLASSALREFEATGIKSGPIFEEYSEARSKFEKEASRQLVQIQELFRTGKGQADYVLPGRTLKSPISWQALFQGAILAQDATRAFPKNEAIGELAGIQSLLPKVTLRLHPSSRSRLGDVVAKASGRVMDPVTSLHGELIPLGELPIEQSPLLPGEWRFIVEVEGVGFGEYDRIIALHANELLIEARILPAQEVLDDMTLIEVEGNTFPTWDEAANRPTEYLAEPAFPLPLANYHMETYAVSNGEYLTFMEATGAPAPHGWRTASGGDFNGDWKSLPVEELGERWLKLPVTGVSILHMRDFAEFHGKRLPTHYEQEFAGRGPDHRPYPWGMQPDSGQYKANTPEAEKSKGTNNRKNYRILQSLLVPVDAAGYAHPPFGLYHTYGNIQYASWGPVNHEVDGRITPKPDERYSFGVSAFDANTGFNANDHSTHSIGNSSYHPDLGFRCAKSVIP